MVVEDNVSSAPERDACQPLGKLGRVSAVGRHDRQTLYAQWRNEGD